MPLQNRVDPAGSIHAVDARGLFTGNRGVIHDPDMRRLTARRWTTKAWIICQCAFKGRRRDVFGRNGRNGGAGWTNLFFLDEVTALAAGHRPCFECRRADALAYADCFARGNGLGEVKAAEMDRLLHRERLGAGAVAPTLDSNAISTLPDGAILRSNGGFLAKRGTVFRAWAFHGYGNSRSSPESAVLITPPATVAALRAGYPPVWHSSA